MYQLQIIKICIKWLPVYCSLHTLLSASSALVPSVCQPGNFEDWTTDGSLGIYYQHPTKVTPGISCSTCSQEDISIPQQKTMKQKGQDYLVEQKCSLFSHQWHIEHAFIVAVHCSDMEMLPDVLYRLLYSTWYSHIVCKSQLGSVTYRISKCTVVVESYGLGFHSRYQLLW